jgi:hypothetical protein
MSLMRAPAVAAPARLPDAICSDLNGLLGLHARAVVARTVPREASYVGIVTVREPGDGTAPRFVTATAVGRDEAEALAAATFSALGGSDDLLALYAGRLCAGGKVRSATVVDCAGIRFQQDGAAAGVHVGLVGILPSPGRLAVATDECEHRVLCLPDAALATTTETDAPVAADIEASMQRIESAVYDCLWPDN